MTDLIVIPSLRLRFRLGGGVSSSSNARLGTCLGLGLGLGLLRLIIRWAHLGVIVDYADLCHHLGEADSTQYEQALGCNVVVIAIGTF